MDKIILYSKGMTKMRVNIKSERTPVVIEVLMM